MKAVLRDCIISWVFSLKLFKSPHTVFMVHYWTITVPNRRLNVPVLVDGVVNLVDVGGCVVDGASVVAGAKSINHA